MPHFPLTVSIQAKAKLEKKAVESANIVASLPGNDPQLKNEYVVLSAHIDHVGIGEPINGDRIYNGAMDNASGVAVLLDVAASLKKHPENLKRSLLFVFVTGEEKGLLGSKYFAAHPTVDPKSMVADINIDMFRPSGAAEDAHRPWDWRNRTLATRPGRWRSRMVSRSSPIPSR